MGLAAVSKREGLETDITTFIMLFDGVTEAFYEDPTKPLGLTISPGVVSGRDVVLNLQHGADSVKELEDKLSFAIDEHICPSAVRVHPVVQGHVDDNGGRDSPERCGAI